MQIRDNERNKMNHPLILHLSALRCLHYSQQYLQSLQYFFFLPRHSCKLKCVYWKRTSTCEFHRSSVWCGRYNPPKVPEFVYFCGEQSSKTLCSVSSLNGQVLIMPSWLFRIPLLHHLKEETSSSPNRFNPHTYNLPLETL